MSRAASPLASIQYLRGIAAMMVAYFHLAAQIPVYAPLLSGGSWFDVSRLSAGVDIFFVISGFIMIVTSKRLSAIEFARRRIARIVPLYWILTLLLAGICIFSPAFFRSTHLTSAALIKSLLFVPYNNPNSGGELSPLLVPGWSLNIEMFFYFIFTLTMLGPLRKFQELTISGFFAALVLIFIFGAEGPIAVFYSQPRILEFCAGVLLGRMYLRGHIHIFVMPALLACGFALLIQVHPVRYGWDMLLPSSAIVGAAVMMEREGLLPSLPWLGQLGDASYSIYLSHIFTLGAMRAVWERLPPTPGPAWAAIFAAVSIAAVAGAGLLCYRLIERPLMRILNHKKAVPA